MRQVGKVSHRVSKVGRKVSKAAHQFSKVGRQFSKVVHQLSKVVLDVLFDFRSNQSVGCISGALATGPKRMSKRRGS